MADDFGKQFTIAREALGLSIKEVASKVKIREEYVEDIENNVFDFPLPNVYIRGFIRNYARLLRLDVDQVMARCPVHEFQASESIKRNAVVEYIKDDSQDEDSNDSENASPNHLRSSIDALRQKLSSIPRRKVIIGGAAVSILTILILIACVVGMRRESFNIDDIIPVAPGSVATRTIVLSATGEVKVIVRNKDSLEKIYSGTLMAGTAKTIAYYKPIQVFYDHGEYLLIEQDNGEKVWPQPGRGGVEVK